MCGLWGEKTNYALRTYRVYVETRGRFNWVQSNLGHNDLRLHVTGIFVDEDVAAAAGQTHALGTHPVRLRLHPPRTQLVALRPRGTLPPSLFHFLLLLPRLWLHD